MPDSRAEIADWLVLRHTPGLGPGGTQTLLERVGDAGRIRRAGRRTLSEAGLAGEAIDFLHAPNLPGAVERELEWAAGAGHHIIAFDDPAYPPQLKTIPAPPPVLYVRGDPALLGEPQLALVGSRNPTAGGLENAKSFAAHFSRAGLVITSGLALGIDGAAHRAALDAGGPTVAVMATGADRVYPARHKGLAEAILERGALVTEMPLGTRPLPALFPQRNRIISGLSLGVLVVEAARRSGSLITARLAGEQAREVFAIPGSIHNPLARGCHHLIRQGARLVESAQDILEELAPRLRGLLEEPEQAQSPAAEQSPERDDDAEYARLLAALGHDPVPVDLLIERTGLAARDVASMLLILELEGRVQVEPGGLYSRRDGRG